MAEVQEKIGEVEETFVVGCPKSKQQQKRELKEKTITLENYKKFLEKKGADYSNIRHNRQDILTALHKLKRGKSKLHVVFEKLHVTNADGTPNNVVGHNLYFDNHCRLIDVQQFNCINLEVITITI